MKKSITRTAVGIMVQASKLLGRPYEYPKYTTLNEYYNINPEAHLDLKTLPNLGYYAIGQGAHRLHVDDRNVPTFDPIAHETTDTGPYLGMPFVLRRTNDDLDTERRNRYALRRKETHNGIEYWAYYLKRIPQESVSPDVIHDNTQDGVTVSKPFVFTNDNLHPTPNELPSFGVTVASADIIRVSSRVVIDFNEEDVAEFFKVCEVLGNDTAICISEILICTGTDKRISVEGVNGQTLQMNEAIGVQVVTFVSFFASLVDANRGFYHEFDVAEGEPLITKGETRSTRYSTDVQPSVNAERIRGTIYDASNRQNGSDVSTTASISASNPTPTPNPANPASEG